MADLAEIERYLINQAPKTSMHMTPTGIQSWLRARFAELRLREKAKKEKKEG